MSLRMHVCTQEEAAMGNSVEKLKNAIGAFEACRKSLSEALHDRKRRFKKTRKCAYAYTHVCAHVYTQVFTRAHTHVNKGTSKRS